MDRRLSFKAQLLAGLFISLLFLAYALRQVDGPALLEAFSSADLWPSLPTLLALIGASCVLRAMRWSLILSPIAPCRPREAFPALMVGLMGNNIYPAHLGEVLRAYAFAKPRGLPFSTVFSTLLVERLFDVITILALFGVSLGHLEESAELSWVEPGALLMSIAAVVGLLVLALLARWPEASVGLVARAFCWLPGAGARRLETLTRDLLAGLAIAGSPFALFGCLVSSGLIWLCLGLAPAVALEALGVDLSLAQSFFLLGVTTFAVTLPSAPGFFGVIQVAFTEGLAPFGVASTTAFAGSVLYHVANYVPLTLGGLWCLRGLGLDLDEARAERASMEAGDG